MRQVVLFLLLLVWGAPAIAVMSAHLDRTRIAEGEDVRLIVQVEGQTRAQPDFSRLGKDFDILSNSSGMQVRLINGVKSAQTTWTVTMRPLKKGKITIAPIAVGKESSEPLALEVLAAGKAPAGKQQAADAGNSLFVETDISVPNPYVQQMVLYKVRIFHSVKILEGELKDPELDSAMVRQLEPDKKYTADRKGKRYRVIERRYVVYPLESGEVVIPEAVLTAKIPDTSRKGSPFKGLLDKSSIFGNDPFFSQSPLGGFLGNARSVVLKGARQVMQVQPPSGESTGSYWVPATNLTVRESFNVPDGGVKVGEPVTRAITVRAEGLTGEQIPDLVIASPAGARVYPDKAATRSSDMDTGVLGEKSQRFAFVPSQAGKLLLPAVKVLWWDVQEGVEKIAHLPERTVEVLPPENQPAPIAAEAVATPVPVIAPAHAELLNDHSLTSTGVGSSLWKWLVAALVVLVLGMLAWILKLSNKLNAIDHKPANKPPVPRNLLSATEARKQLNQACKQNSPEAARQALLAWAETEWPENPPSGLENLSRRFRSETAQQAISNLEAVLYAGSQKKWDGKAFADAIPSLPSRARKKPSADKKLPELFS